MNTRSLSLESLDERDRRITRERQWKVVRELAEWLLVVFIAAVIGAILGFTKGIDYGQAMEKRAAAQMARPGFSCKAAKAIANGSICRGM